MKKLIILLSLLFSGKAYASPYIAIEMQDNNLNYKSPSNFSFHIDPNKFYQKEMRNPSIHLGYEVSDLLSMEVGIVKGEERKDNNNTGLVYTSGPLNGQSLKTSSEIKALLISFDSIYSYQVPETNFIPFGILGVTYADFSFKESFNDGSTYSDDEQGLGINLGFGLAYKFNQHFSLRLKAKYTLLNDIKPTSINGVGEVKDVVRFGAGFKVTF